jgi:hypothetical protein
VQTRWNNNLLHRIGTGNVSDTFDGYLADVYLLDGIATDPSSFTTTDLTTGQLIPKAYTGSYGTNGFKLNFSDNSTTAALGTDTSGNGNTWTVNNFSVLGTIASPNWSAGLVSSTGSFASGYPAANAFDGNTGTGAATSTGGGLSVNLTWTSTNFNSGNPTLRVYTYQNYKIDVNGVTKNADGAGPASLAWVNCGTISGGFSTVVVYGYSGSNSGSYIAAIEVNGQILVGPSVAAGNDSLVDTPTSYGTDTGAGNEVRGNYCTWNPLVKSVNNDVTLSNGNLLYSKSAATGWSASAGTLAASSGKWYFELTVPSGTVFCGVASTAMNFTLNALQDNSSERSKGFLAFCDDGRYLLDGAARTTYSSSLSAGQVLGVAVDLDGGTAVFYKNGTSQGSISISSSALIGKQIVPVIIAYYSGEDWNVNFGQRAWAYTPPANHKAWCDTNLPAPVVAKPDQVFQTVVYTGNGSVRNITGLAFNPDLVWIKSRSAATDHKLTDSVRGETKSLSSNSTAAETTDTNGLTTFNSDGFSLGTDTNYNNNAATYVGWAFDGGTSTVTNTAGSITSQVRANPSAGFSVITYTGNGTPQATLGHGLGVAPNFLITKCRSNATDWVVNTTATGSYTYSFLNLTDPLNADVTNVPTSTLISRGSANTVNGSGLTYVCYAFAPVTGYSSFGSYTGNGSSSGPFVYTGFKPKWLMIKVTQATGNPSLDAWLMYDAVRDTYNVATQYLYANASQSEGGYAIPDLLSNGFKIRASSTESNQNGNVYIYAAFAENPFQYARAR